MEVKTDIKVEDAAKQLKMGRPLLEQWLRSGECPFGFYLREDSRGKGKYYINENRYKMYLTGEDMRPICPYADKSRYIPV